METQIAGQYAPVLTVSLAPGESIVGESGELSWYGGDVSLQTGKTMGMSKGGLLGAVKRAASGGTYFMTQYTAGSQGFVAFAVNAPGEIRELALDGSRAYVVHRHGFMCCQQGVELEVFLQKKLGVGIFGKEGFLLQKLSGTGNVWIELHGQVVPFTLEAGQKLLVHPGHLGLFDATVSLDLTQVPGIKNKLFGADGLFLAQLTGPGEVWLQTVTLAGLAHALQPYIVTETGGEVGTAAVLGSLLKNN